MRRRTDFTARCEGHAPVSFRPEPCRGQPHDGFRISVNRLAPILLLQDAYAEIPIAAIDGIFHVDGI